MLTDDEKESLRDDADAYLRNAKPENRARLQEVTAYLRDYCGDDVGGVMMFIVGVAIEGDGNDGE